MTGLDTIDHFPISEVNGPGGVGYIFGIMGDHDNRLAFSVKGLKKFHDLSSRFCI